jgi:5-methylcytosine-specific restriction endonuclease McrA
MAKGLCSSCYAKQYKSDPVKKQKIDQQKKDWYYRYHDDNLIKRAEYRNSRYFDGLRDAVLSRDAHKCVNCSSENNLTVHHKDRNGRGKPTPNNDLSNLETLCRRCHLLEHVQELKEAKNKKMT